MKGEYNKLKGADMYIADVLERKSFVILSTFQKRGEDGENVPMCSSKKEMHCFTRVG